MRDQVVWSGTYLRREKQRQEGVEPGICCPLSLSRVVCSDPWQAYIVSIVSLLTAWVSTVPVLSSFLFLSFVFLECVNFLFRHNEIVHCVVIFSAPFPREVPIVRVSRRVPSCAAARRITSFGARAYGQPPLLGTPTFAGTTLGDLEVWW